MTSFRLASVIVLLSSVSRLFAAAPPNDNFNNAILLVGTNLTVQGTNVDATREVGEPNHGSNPGGRSVWWSWVAPAVGSVIVQTTGSSFDTLLAAYTGALVGNLTSLDSNDDNGSVKTSLIGFNVSPGVTYRIAVDGYGGKSGDISLTLSFRTGPVARPVNDDFAAEIPLTGPIVTTTGANYLATKERNEPNHADELGGASVWWTWTAPLSGPVTISTEGSNFDTLLGVYKGSALTNLTVVASSDDINTNQPTSRVTFNAVAQTAYQIAVDGFDGEPGDIKLQVTMSDVLFFGTPQPLTSGAFKLMLTGTIGQRYHLEGSTNFASWQVLGTLTNLTGTVEFTDPPLTNSNRRFYRAQQIP